MKQEERLLEVLGRIDGRYIEEAEPGPRARRRPARAVWAAAACICLAAAAIPFFVRRPAAPQAGPGTPAAAMDLLPHFEAGGIKYYISSHLSAAPGLPDGFEKAGMADVTGAGACPCFLNPDVPERAYVYQETRTDGETDPSGTLISTQPHKAYVLYVDERLRGRDLICRGGRLYISMWSADPSGGVPDVTREYYDEILALYGVRIEGQAPEGFVPAGTAEFSGYDTIPAGTLSSNAGAAEVCWAPGRPDVVLAAARWYTATAGENGETRHDGFDVYLLYGGPLLKTGEAPE